MSMNLFDQLRNRFNILSLTVAEVGKITQFQKESSMSVLT